jgi:hypothetical protein
VRPDVGERGGLGARSGEGDGWGGGEPGGCGAAREGQERGERGGCGRGGGDRPLHVGWFWLCDGKLEEADRMSELRSGYVVRSLCVCDCGCGSATPPRRHAAAGITDRSANTDNTTPTTPLVSLSQPRHMIFRSDLCVRRWIMEWN